MLSTKNKISSVLCQDLSVSNISNAQSIINEALNIKLPTAWYKNNHNNPPDKEKHGK